MQEFKIYHQVFFEVLNSIPPQIKSLHLSFHVLTKALGEPYCLLPQQDWLLAAQILGELTLNSLEITLVMTATVLETHSSQWTWSPRSKQALQDIMEANIGK